MYHIAVFNIAEAKFPMDDNGMKAFNDALDMVNAEAESSQGFVWRLKEDSGNATNIRIYKSPNILVNLSVWKSIDELKAYIYNGDHLSIFVRKKEWFVPRKNAHMVMWYIPEGHIPTAKEGKVKLEHLIQHGSSQEAFGFRQIFDAPA